MTAQSPTRRERGVSIMITSLVLIPLMIFAAFGVDLAAWYSRITDLQRAADAAALAGAVWMPSLGGATVEATASLRSNGLIDGQDGIEITIARGSTPTSLRVTVSDTDAPRYFSQTFTSGNQTLTRSAEAEYKLPLPLGSPLNYFGGDAAKTVPATVIDYFVDWPTDSSTRQPRNYSSAGCNVGNNAAYGRWNTSGTFVANSIDSADPLCVWTVTGTFSGTATAEPPPDYFSRIPTNGTSSTACSIRTGGSTTGAILGRWQSSLFSTSTSTTTPLCTWLPATTDNASLHPNHTSLAPTNRPCRVGYETSLGWWPASSAHSTTSVPSGGASNLGAAGGTPTNTGNQLCRWSAVTHTVDNTPPNPIAADRSPGFWAQIHGPGADQQSGDGYSTRCRTTTNCATIDNDLYVDPSNPDAGYWYVVKIPAGGGGQMTIRVFDAQLTPGSLSAGTGDSSISGTADFGTTYRVYEQTNPLDFTVRSPVTSGSANQTPNSCNWDLDGQTAFRLQWVDLCTINTAPNDIYLINVRTAVNGTASSAGRNGYAIEACLSSSCTTGVQPALYAFERMVMYNNVDGGDATFYIAEVGPQYAGKTLVLDLFDPGEASGQAWVYPMMPSSSATGAVVHLDDSQCTFESTRSGYPRVADLNNGGNCSFRSSDGGALYNGHWVSMSIDIPTTYDCTVGRDPESESGSCWWGIQYDFTASATDTTTWRARIEGNPLQLTQ